MKDKPPDIGVFTHGIFHKKNVMACLLSFSRQLMTAELAGLVYGTDTSERYFLSPNQWDRGITDKFAGRGARGILLKLFGKHWARFTGMSPVYLYRTDEMGDRVNKDGITAYTLRNHNEFYNLGIKILLIDHLSPESKQIDPSNFKRVSVTSYDGIDFISLKEILADTSIINRFKAKNFISAYVPDYGAIVFNNLDDSSLVDAQGCFILGADLKLRLDILTSSIKKASLAHLGRVRGKSSAMMIWRKEKGLRKTAVRLNEKAALLKEQENYLLAVGAVTPAQFNMSPVSVHDGVYGFMDMVGSVKVSRQLLPKDYFFVLNACHEIAAENAGRFGCRVDNFIGDAVFFENLSVFDPDREKIPGPVERLMLVTLLLASVLVEIHKLFKGAHPIDRERRVYSLLKPLGRDVGFRAGMNQGRAMVGPLGSKKRKIVTAVGEAVDLASRLESSGSQNHIHTTAYLAGLLQEAWISKETKVLYHLAGELLPQSLWAQNSGFYFFDYFKTLFKINGPLVVEINESSYKEFSMSDTRLIRCLPDGGPSICSGI